MTEEEELDEIVKRELGKEDWRHLDSEHNKRREENKRLLNAPTRAQVISREEFSRMVTKKFHRVRTIRKDPKQYKSTTLLLPNWAWKLLPKIVKGQMINSLPKVVYKGEAYCDCGNQLLSHKEAGNGSCKGCKLLRESDGKK